MSLRQNSTLNPSLHEPLRHHSRPHRPHPARRLAHASGKVKHEPTTSSPAGPCPPSSSSSPCLSSWIGSGSLLGGAENAYRHGFAALWQAAGGWAGLALIYFIAPRARHFAQYTIPDLLEARYNQTARVLGVIAILFTYTAITSYQFIGGGDILHLIFPASSPPSTAATSSPRSSSCLPPSPACPRSPTWTSPSACSPPSPCRCAARAASTASGGWTPSAPRCPRPTSRSSATYPFTATYGPPSSGRHRRAFQSALEIFLPTCLLMLGNQSMYQKFFSAKSEKDATRASVGWIVGTVILETVIVALAVVGSAIFPDRARCTSTRARFWPTPACTASAAGAGRSCDSGSVAGRSHLRQDRFHRQQLPVLPADQPGQRSLRPLRQTRREQQAGPLVSRLMVVLLGLWALYQGLHTE